MKTDSNIILAIETAIEGGSLAILKDNIEIATWTGTKQVSKAEDVLEKISELLNEQDIKKSELDFIAVSKGPGSSTGIKIGLAIAKGLGNALNIEAKEISAFEALIEGNESFSSKITVAVLPVGKNLLCRQIFNNGNPSENSVYENPKTLSAEEFRIELNETTPAQIVFYKKAFETCAALLTDSELKGKIFIIENILAYLIGKTSDKSLRVR